jgi:hypothetical protein
MLKRYSHGPPSSFERLVVSEAALFGQWFELMPRVSHVFLRQSPIEYQGRKAMGIYQKKMYQQSYCLQPSVLMEQGHSLVLFITKALPCAV